MVVMSFTKIVALVIFSKFKDISFKNINEDHPIWVSYNGNIPLVGFLNWGVFNLYYVKFTILVWFYFRFAFFKYK